MHTSIANRLMAVATANSEGKNYSMRILRSALDMVVRARKESKGMLVSFLEAGPREHDMCAIESACPPLHVKHLERHGNVIGAGLGFSRCRKIVRLTCLRGIIVKFATDITFVELGP